MSQKTIFVVDDQQDIRTTLRTLLEKEGYTVIEACSGDDCLTKLKRTTPDLILLDIMMPGTPAIEVVRKIKDIKIFYLSAVRATDDEKEQIFRESNVLDFIEKPFNVKDLLTRVKKAVPP